MDAADPILSLRDLKVTFDTLDGPVQAVKGLNLTVHAGETLAIVGESGSGKSQAMMAAMGLLASNGRASGIADYRGTNLVGLPKRQLNRIRGRKITMIFQEPMTSLDPLYRIGDQIEEPIRQHQGLGRAAAREKALEMLRLVHMPDPERRLRSYPHELSGGQRQRVMIAMALANSPDVLIADEPTTALDVTTQAQILELLQGLVDDFGMGLLLITHDLAVVSRIADRIVVMQKGAVVETGPTAQLLAQQSHPYTRMLFAAARHRVDLPPAPAPVPLLRVQGVVRE
jgi:oligopeptide transport system ATP-binding protein